MIPPQQHPSRPYNDKYSSDKYSSPPSRPLQRPPSRLPEGYTPNSTLPPGYTPPFRDIHVTGAIVHTAQQAKLSHRQMLMIGIGVLAIVLVTAIAATLIATSLLAQATATGPEATLQTFYNELRTSDYTHAYLLLSPGNRAKQSETTFVSVYKQLDTLNGTMVSYTIPALTANGNHATAIVQAIRNNGEARTETDSVQLVQTGGNWYIDSIVPHYEGPAPATP